MEKEKHSKLSWFQKRLIDLCKTGGVPAHIAFVMDGNRRFARNQNSGTVLYGHEKGFDSLLFVLEACLALGVKIVTVYAFSEENFSRPADEVEGLMKLAKEKFGEFLKVEEFVMKEGVVVDMWGRPEILPEDVRLAAAKVVIGTQNNSGARLNICFAYSGTEEIALSMRAISKGLSEGKLLNCDVNEDLIAKCSYLGNLKPPDLLIRTSGETRLSDFLLLHLKQSQLRFIEVLWPELSLYHVLVCVLDWQWTGGKLSQENPRKNDRIDNFIISLQNDRLQTWLKVIEHNQIDGTTS